MAEVKVKYNNFPPESRLNVKLPEEKTVMYRLLGSYDPISKKYHLRTQTIPQADFVVDRDTNETYHVAIIERELPNGEVELGDITFHSDQMCVLRLDLRSPRDIKRYKYMEISNFNDSNKDRDTNQPAYFEKITHSTDYDATRKHRKLVKQAFAIIDSMSIDDVRSFIKATPRIVLKSQEDETLINALEEFAELHPGEIIDSNGVGLSNFEQEVDKLVKDGFISYDKQAAAWHLKNGKPLVQLNKTFTKNPQGELVQVLLKKDAVLAELRAFVAEEQPLVEVPKTPAPKKLK